jgi:hypothetical protein
LDCHLCKHNPNRKCAGSFNGKYLVGDILKAKCGASIWVEVVDITNGKAASAEQLGNLYFEVLAFTIAVSKQVHWPMSAARATAQPALC